MSEPTNTEANTQAVLALSPDETRALTEVLDAHANSLIELAEAGDVREVAADLQNDPTIDHASQEYDDALERARTTIQEAYERHSSDATAASELADQIRQTSTVDLPDAATLAGIRSALDETGWSLHDTSDLPPENMRRVMEATDTATTTQEDLITEKPYLDPSDADEKQRLEAQWVATVSEVNTYVAHGLSDPLRARLDELDENLQAWKDGEVAPGSDEMYGVYHDAVDRSAIPYGTPPISISDLATKLRDTGVNVPDFDPTEAAQRLGIHPTSEAAISRTLEASGQANEPTAALKEVASARVSVRRGLASIEQDGAAAREHLSAANTSLNTAVEELRPSGAGENVAAAHESVRQATERVDALTETSKQLSATDAPETEQAARDAEAEVTIYTTPSCPGCVATKRALDKAGVEFEAIDLSTRPDLVAKFKKQGLAQSPIVETQDGDRWAGFNPSKLKEHGLDYRTRQPRGGEHGTDTGLGR